MPKVGMEPIQRRSLVDAAISAFHARGSLDVTIRDIAVRAGVSQGLAHHYFGSKDALIASAMRHLLTEYGRQVRSEMKGAITPRERISAIILASLGPAQFKPETVSVWLVFYTCMRRRFGAGARAAFRLCAAACFKPDLQPSPAGR